MAATVTIYGIKNCDTMKKARAWLEGRGVAYDSTTTRYRAPTRPCCKAGPARSAGRPC